MKCHCTLDNFTIMFVFSTKPLFFFKVTVIFILNNMWTFLNHSIQFHFQIHFLKSNNICFHHKLATELWGFQKINHHNNPIVEKKLSGCKALMLKELICLSSKIEGKKIDDFEFESKVLIFLQSKIALCKRSSISYSLDKGFICSEFVLVIEVPWFMDSILIFKE